MFFAETVSISCTVRKQCGSHEYLEHEEKNALKFGLTSPLKFPVFAIIAVFSI